MMLQAKRLLIILFSFNLCFETIGACNSTSNITIFGEAGFEIEVSSNEVLLPHAEVPGTVKITCDIPNVIFEKINVICNGQLDGRILGTMEGGNVNDYNFYMVQRYNTCCSGGW